MILPVIESFVLCFTLLLICVLNVRNTPVGGVHFYEKDVQERTIELGFITREEIKKNKVISAIPFMMVLLIAAPLMVFFVNNAESFLEGFLQLAVMYMLCGLFDKVFIDWYWVGHTKAWVIPGTEDLMPYINKKVWVKKIAAVVVLYPLLAALLSWIMCLILHL